MKKVYPVIKNTFRFLGGSPWSVPKQLWELTVSKGYEVTPSGQDDFIIRGAGRPIMIDKKNFEFYFEPFVDYFAEPIIVEEVETSEDVILSSSEETHEEFTKVDVEPVVELDKGQLSLF